MVEVAAAAGRIDDPLWDADDPPMAPLARALRNGADGLAHRPALTLAAAAWGAYALVGAGVVEEAVRYHDSVKTSLSFVATGLTGLPSLCVLIAAGLVLTDRATRHEETGGSLVAAAVVMVSAIVTAAMTAAGMFALPLWSSPTSASTWEPALSPYLIGITLALVAVGLADRAVRGPAETWTSQ